MAVVPPEPSETVAAAISAWEYECCGEPLAVGAIGDFTLVPWAEGAQLPMANGRIPVTSRIERHVVSDTPRHLRARVVGLWEWRRTSAPSPSESVAYEPLPRMRIIDDQRPSTSGGPGWIVALEVIGELPPPEGGVYDGGPAD